MEHKLNMDRDKLNAECSIPLKGYPSNGRRSSESYSKKDGLRKRIRRYFRDYCDSSSVVGFKYLGEKRSRGERLLWAALIILATIISVYYILEIYNKYEENPFMVSLATRESAIYTIPFPAVTVCPVAKANVVDFNYTDIVHRIWDNKSLTTDEILNAQYMTMLCSLDDDVYNDFFTQNSTFEANEFFDTISYLKPTRSDIFFICIFMGEMIPCDDIFIPIIIDDGICYSFNILNREDIFKDNVQHYGKYHQALNKSTWNVEDGYPKDATREVYPMRALMAGAENALEIYMTQNVQDTDYLCMADAAGYAVQIHTPHSIPQMKRQFFSVPLDSSTQAVVTPNMVSTSAEVKAYKVKDRLCYFTDERHLKYFKIYTPANCRMECIANYTLERCGCVKFYMPRDNETAICGNGNLKCMERAEKLQREEELDRILSGSMEGCNCMPLCTELSYDAETTRTVWHWREQFAAERLEQRYGDFFGGFTETRHFSRLTVFFKSEQFIPSQRNELYGFFDFLSNFGGLLGLFTGFSLLSAVELIYFISVRLWCNSRLYNDFSGPPQTEV